MLELELKCDARRSEIRFTPLGSDRYLICVPDTDSNLSIYINESQALTLYKLLRLYLRSPLARWGPEAVADLKNAAAH
ncbi:MAG TPA: hypothetical protein GX513_02245 [Firmicutes bacterium]|nr:hypothetical protein [Bacillota bacterium]